MAKTDETTREKIILATIECIEREGLHSVTIRSIAREAGVNSAAINYYFRTKEKLIEVTLQQTIEHSLNDLREILDDTSLPPRKVLQNFLLYLLEGSLRYPELAKAHYYEPFINNRYDGRFIGWINANLGKLKNVLRPLIDTSDDTEIKIILIQILSSIMFQSLAPDIFNDFTKFSLRDSAIQYRYIDILLDHFIGKEGRQ